jgi:uncharacterized membrane protein YsdA (DUF1294 family)
VSLAFPLLFLLCLAGAVFIGRLPVAILAVYVIASVGTYLLYAHDKAAARADRWRTAESTLHLLSVVGGWPGALVAQTLLRHKTSKPSFRFVFWVTILVNCMALAWWVASS